MPVGIGSRNDGAAVAQGKLTLFDIPLSSIAADAEIVSMHALPSKLIGVTLHQPQAMKSGSSKSGRFFFQVYGATRRPRSRSRRSVGSASNVSAIGDALRRIANR